MRAPPLIAPRSTIREGSSGTTCSSLPVPPASPNGRRRVQGISTKGFPPSTALIGGGFVPASSSNGLAMNYSSPPPPGQCPMLTSPASLIPTIPMKTRMDIDGASVSTYTSSNMCDSIQSTPRTSPSRSLRSKPNQVPAMFAYTHLGDQHSALSADVSGQSSLAEIHYPTSQCGLEEPAPVRTVPEQSSGMQRQAPAKAFYARQSPFASAVHGQSRENVEQSTEPHSNSSPTPDISVFLQSTLTRCPPDPTTHMPFGVIAQPFAAHLPAPTSHFARCEKCKGYVNPHIEFQDRFENWICSLCARENTVSDDMTIEGQFVGNRPDIQNSSVEYFGPKTNADAPPYLREPRYLFLLDISVEAVQSGSLAAACRGIQASLDELSQYGALKVGIMTYDKTIHFYDLSGRRPRMIVLPDMEDLYEVDACPFFLPVTACRPAFELLLEKLPALKVDGCVPSSDFYSALSAANMMLKVTGGKVFALTVTPPSRGSANNDLVEGLLQREVQRSLQPADQAIVKIGELLAKNQIACDIFAASDKFQDIASLRAVCLNGGVVRKYKISNQELHNFEHDICSAATSFHAFDVMFRVRVSAGWKVDLQFGIDSDDAQETPGLYRTTAHVPTLTTNSIIPFCIQPKSVGKTNRDRLIVQFACVYINMHGERRIRTHTQRYKAEIDFGVVNPSAMLTLVNHQAMRESLRTNNLEGGKKIIVDTLQDVSRRVRADAPQEWEVVSRLLYGMLHSQAFKSAGARNVDDNLLIWERLREYPTAAAITLAFPQMWRLSDISQDGCDLSNTMPLTCREMSNNESYLLFDGQRWVLWIGAHAECTKIPDGDHHVPYRIHMFLTRNGLQVFPTATFTTFRSKTTFMR